MKTIKNHKKIRFCNYFLDLGRRFAIKERMSQLIKWIQLIKTKEVKMRKRLLILDEDVNMCELLQMELRECGYDVTGTSVTTQAFTMLQRQPYDLVVIDLKSPWFRGDQIIQRIQESSGGANVILHSGYKRFEKEAARFKSIEFVLKSANLEHLIQTIDTTFHKAA